MYDYLMSVMETDDVTVLNEKLRNKWKLLSISTGKKENGEAYFLYAIGELNEREMILDSL
jgi:hypothetical protein|nr:MAG TPA: hypothetical protein [Caudoviricetes sp.]